MLRLLALTDLPQHRGHRRRRQHPNLGDNHGDELGRHSVVAQVQEPQRAQLGVVRVEVVPTTRVPRVLGHRGRRQV